MPDQPSADRPARPSDIARAALDAARAASASRPRPTRRRVAGPRRSGAGPRPGAGHPQPRGSLRDTLVSQHDLNARTNIY
ncbi:hypothetical protein ACI79A_12560, partial [Modestobacter sp. SYSU DS0657]